MFHRSCSRRFPGRPRSNSGRPLPWQHCVQSVRMKNRKWLDGKTLAPACLPSPINIIFIRPLLMSPANTNEVCGFTRLQTMTWSAANAVASKYTGNPSAAWHTIRLSILDRIGHPQNSSVTPYDSRICFCPTAVPPPWLSIAGTTNGSAHSRLTVSHNGPGNAIDVGDAATPCRPTSQDNLRQLETCQFVLHRCGDVVQSRGVKLLTNSEYPGISRHQPAFLSGDRITND